MFSASRGVHCISPMQAAAKGRNDSDDHDDSDDDYDDEG